MRSTLLVGLVVLGLSSHSRANGEDRPSTNWREVVRPGEASEFREFGRQIGAMQVRNAKGGPHRRVFHAKPHAGVLAEFRVLPGLPAYARQGVFARPRTYPAYVRFSNGVGVLRPDLVPDVRGAAIKLVGVGGPKLLPAQRSAVTQDFLMLNAPASMARDGRQFMAFARATASGALNPVTLIRAIGWREAGRMMKALTTSTLPVRSLVTTQYWSCAAIKMGPYAVRYSLKQSATQDPWGSSRFGPRLEGPRGDFLRRDFHQRRAELRFDFMVQFFVDEARTPIEDTSRVWDPKQAPFLKVAELVIVPLDPPEAQAVERYTNALSFNPWHTIAAHRPLGHLQRSRRAAYEASVMGRGARAEPERIEYRVHEQCPDPAETRIRGVVSVERSGRHRRIHIRQRGVRYQIVDGDRVPFAVLAGRTVEVAGVLTPGTRELTFRRLLDPSPVEVTGRTRVKRSWVLAQVPAWRVRTPGTPPEVMRERRWTPVARTPLAGALKCWSWRKVRLRAWVYRNDAARLRAPLLVFVERFAVWTTREILSRHPRLGSRRIPARTLVEVLGLTANGQAEILIRGRRLRVPLASLGARRRE